MFSKHLAVLALVATLVVASPVAKAEAEAAPVADPQWGWPYHAVERDANAAAEPGLEGTQSL